MGVYTKERAPTVDEVAAHAAKHGDAEGDGGWLVSRGDVLWPFCTHDPRAARSREEGIAWTPLSDDGRPVPWPSGLESEGLEVAISVAVAPDGSWSAHRDPRQARAALLGAGHDDAQMRTVRARVPAYGVPEVQGVTDAHPRD